MGIKSPVEAKHSTLTPLSRYRTTVPLSLIDTLKDGVDSILIAPPCFSDFKVMPISSTSLHVLLLHPAEDGEGSGHCYHLLTIHVHFKL